MRIPFDTLRDALGEQGSEISAYVDRIFEGERQELFIACLLNVYGLPNEAYKLGRTVVFFREDQLEGIDSILNGVEDTKVCPYILS